STKRAEAEIESKKQKTDEHVEVEKDYDQEEAEMKEYMEIVIDEDAIDVIPLATKPTPIVDFYIHTKGRPGCYEIFRVDG
ncbi:hypothetical protein Tco_0636652, partial [Tanacetum coccineum]